MTNDGQSPELAPVAELVDDLRLRELGYRVEYEERPSGRVTVRLGHPLLLDTVWRVTNDPSCPDWADWIRDRIVSWPDVALMREAVVQPESVPIVAALRHERSWRGSGRRTTQPEARSVPSPQRPSHPQPLGADTGRG